MIDTLKFTRVWQDTEFFQIEVECKTERIVVRSKVYTTDELINDLYKKIDIFLSKNVDSVCWQNGARGDATTPCISFRFFHKDATGHVLIEAFMEIDDGGMLSTHNCCFYINTEIGLLYQFKENLLKLKTPQLGTQILLHNSTGDNSVS